MTPRYELTVIIPTKNRQDTAVTAAQLAAAVGPPDVVEVIVHDCSDDSSLRDRLAGHGLRERVRYVHADEPLSMTENWNRALALANGEYVIVIGDDDAISSQILSVVRWARARGLPAVTGTRSGCYWYPDFSDPTRAGKLRLPRFSGATTIRRDMRALLLECIGTGDLYHRLPMIYHCVINRAVLAQLRQQTGVYVAGVAPDVYSAFAIACLIDRFGDVDYPLSLCGASGSSNTSRLSGGQSHLHLHFREFRRHEFTWIAPDSFALAASLADNMARAFMNLGRDDLLARIDTTHVYARTIVLEPFRCFAHVRKYYLVCRRRREKVAYGMLKLLIYIVAKLALLVTQPLARLLRRWRHAEPDRIRDVTSLARAVEIQDQWLATLGVRAPQASAE